MDFSRARCLRWLKRSVTITDRERFGCQEVTSGTYGPNGRDGVAEDGGSTLRGNYLVCGLKYNASAILNEATDKHLV